MGFARVLPDPELRSCEGCGSPFLPPRKSRLQRFCGHRCAFLKIGEKVRAAASTPEARAKNADARRGRGAGKGYIKRGGRHEHRVVAEEILGRPLLRGEIVHHEDENKRNNAPDNLGVLASQAEHASLHFRGKKRAPRSQCPRGHSLAGDNLYLHPNGRRICLTCRRSYDAAWKRERRKAHA
jgi:hypothetical protein